jgi:hypothetical protein
MCLAPVRFSISKGRIFMQRLGAPRPCARGSGTNRAEINCASCPNGCARNGNGCFPERLIKNLAFLAQSQARRRSLSSRATRRKKRSGASRRLHLIARTRNEQCCGDEVHNAHLRARGIVHGESKSSRDLNAGVIHFDLYANKERRGPAESSFAYKVPRRHRAKSCNT